MGPAFPFAIDDNHVVTDQDGGGIDQSRQHLGEYALDAQAIPFEDKSFDAVIANHMLYHVPDIDCALSEINAVAAQNRLVNLIDEKLCLPAAQIV